VTRRMQQACDDAAVDAAGHRHKHAHCQVSSIVSLGRCGLPRAV
jgi:hypothetical protein